MKSLLLACCVLTSLNFAGSVQGMSLQELENIWGLSSVRDSYRHPLERIEIQTTEDGSKKLLVSSWFEDLSVTKGAIPDRRLYCRFMHSFLYGRAIVRSQAKSLPATEAFSNFPEIKSIRFSFFAVVHRNRPTSPFWDKSPAPPPAAADPNAKLRVTWAREEKAIPYLTMDISRGQWKSIEKFLKSRPYYNYSAFRRELCEPIYKIMPDVRASFSALEEQREN